MEERRLESFEYVLETLRKDIDAVEAEMARLREAGRQRSVTYRQLMANRATLRSMDQRFKEAGL